MTKLQFLNYLMKNLNHLAMICNKLVQLGNNFYLYNLNCIATYSITIFILKHNNNKSIGIIQISVKYLQLFTDTEYKQLLRVQKLIVDNTNTSDHFIFKSRQSLTGLYCRADTYACTACSMSLAATRAAAKLMYPSMKSGFRRTACRQLSSASCHEKDTQLNQKIQPMHI